MRIAIPISICIKLQSIQLVISAYRNLTNTLKVDAF